MASVSLARRHRTVERGGSSRSERTKRAESSSRKSESSKNGTKAHDVTKHKGFRVEYCHINDEFVAIIKDTDMMESAKSMDKAIEKLGRIVKRKVKAAS